MSRGSHPSAAAHHEFLREEMAEMLQQRFWIILPYDLVKHIPALRLSPLGVIPQRDRRPRVIVDFTFSGVNQHTVTVAPYEAMQFGRAFERVLHKIYHAHPRFGPVFLIKVDLADGFYRVPLASSHLPTLGVAFPNLPGEPALVALPLVLPMGWVASPPYFCAVTETVADLANHLLASPPRLPPHPLSFAADYPSDPAPVPRTKTAQLPVCPTAPVPLLPVPVSPEHLHLRRTQIPRTPFTHRTPFHPHMPPKPLAYVDVYMDDFLGLAQGYPALRNNVRSKLFHALDNILRPLEESDSAFARKHPVSSKKLNKGDALWATRKILLGWVVDTVAQTIELPLHRVEKLHAILADLQHRKRVSLLHWQRALGELRSMTLAIPGGRGLFSTLYTGLSDSKASRIRIKQPMRDALTDFQLLSTDLAARPTRLGEIVDSAPRAWGTADASGIGMGGVWLSTDPTFTPTVWRHQFPTSLQSKLVTYENPAGTVSNSDLELSAQIAAQDVLTTIRDCRECTISTFTDNVATRAWHRKGSRTTFGPAAYLLRLLSLHQRFFRYRATIDYLPGPLNIMADDASRLWNLSDTSLLSHFNITYPQGRPWQLLTPRPAMISALISALHCKRSDPASYLPAPSLVMPPGFAGTPTVTASASTHVSAMPPIHFKSSKSLPTVTDVDKYPAPTNLYDLVPWKQRSAPWARRYPAWGPQIRGSTPMVTSTSRSNNSCAATRGRIHPPPGSNQFPSPLSTTFSLLPAHLSN